MSRDPHYDKAVGGVVPSDGLALVEAEPSPLTLGGLLASDIPLPVAKALRGEPALLTKFGDIVITRRARELLVEVDAYRERRPPVDAGTLAELLARPAEPAPRVSEVLPAGGRLVIAAMRKTGKTTLVANLARCLLTGEPFLDSFEVRPVSGRVVVLNYEVTGATFARWANENGVPVDGLYVINLRGRRNLLADDSGRAELVAMIRAQGCEVLAVDPFGRAFTGKSQNDAAEVTPWLVRLDQVAEAAGVAELILTTHAGWAGEHTRGSSALEDWPDSIITMTRDTETDQRFLRADGRDVALDEDALRYDPLTRRLSMTGLGNRKATRSIRHIEDLVPSLVTVITSTPGLNITQIEAAFHAAGTPVQKGDTAKASALALSQGLIDVTTGLRGARMHFLPPTRLDL